MYPGCMHITYHFNDGNKLQHLTIFTLNRGNYSMNFNISFNTWMGNSSVTYYYILLYSPKLQIYIDKVKDVHYVHLDVRWSIHYQGL